MGISKNGYWLNEIALSLTPEMRRSIARQPVSQRQDVGNVPISFRANEYAHGKLTDMATNAIIESIIRAGEVQIKKQIKKQIMEQIYGGQFHVRNES